MRKLSRSSERAIAFSLFVVASVLLFIVIELFRWSNAIMTIRRAGGSVSLSEWLHTGHGIKKSYRHSYPIGLPTAIVVTFSKELTNRNVSSLAFFPKKEQLFLNQCLISAHNWESRIRGENIKRLELRRCDFRRKEPIHFDQFPKLVYFEIDDLDELGVRLSKIDRGTSIETIVIRNCNVELQNIQRINRLQRLNSLIFDHAGIADPELREVCGVRLKVLGIISSNVSASTIRELTFENLERLTLREWNPEGAELAFPPTYEIDLSYSNLSSIDSITFPSRLNTIRLDGCAIRRPILEALETCENLYEVSMNHCPEIDVEHVVESLQQCDELLFLEFQGVVISDAFAQRISTKIPSLVRLTASSEDRGGPTRDFVFE